MTITLRQVTGTPNSIVGTWKLMHGNDAVCESKDIVITEDELNTIIEVHHTLVNAILTNRELCTEGYIAKILKKHNVQESNLDWCFDVIRTNALYEDYTAEIVSFSAIKYDDQGIPYQVLINGSPSIF